MRIPAPSPGTQPSRRRSKGRHAWPGSPCQVDILWSNPIRTRLSGWILESAPPAIITSARPRPMIRDASAIARFDDASASVIVLLGPWQSIRMEIWQASMLGKYFSNQIGSIMPIDSRPQTWKSKVRFCFEGVRDCWCQFIELAGDQSGPQVDADSRRFDPAIHQARVGHGQLGRRDRQLDIACHVLLALPQLLCCTWEGRTFFRSKPRTSAATSLGRPATRNASRRRTTPPALHQARSRRSPDDPPGELPGPDRL